MHIDKSQEDGITLRAPRKRFQTSFKVLIAAWTALDLCSEFVCEGIIASMNFLSSCSTRTRTPLTSCFTVLSSPLIESKRSSMPRSRLSTPSKRATRGSRARLRESNVRGSSDFFYLCNLLFSCHSCLRKTVSRKKLPKRRTAVKARITYLSCFRRG